MSAAKLGVIGGSGNDELPGLTRPTTRTAQTSYGVIDLVEGDLDGTPVAHVSRHGAGHVRLSNQVNHHANLEALRECDVTAVVGLTVCGAVDAQVPLGSLIVFDDLHFPSNRLPDGSLCTWHTDPGAAGRGHWIFDKPFSDDLRALLIDATTGTAVASRNTGVYGHVDGPRFNSRSEIAALRAAGVTAVSQTGGPETVLAGEAELPYALLGYVTDYANGVTDEPEPVQALLARMAASARVFAEVLAKVAAGLADVTAPGVVHRFGP